MVRRSWVCLTALLVAGCAFTPATPPVLVAVLPPAAPLPALPPGASPGMRVPAALADGSYPTPNQRVSTAAAAWHLRSGLNVAALACPAEQGAMITAGYNALIAAHKAELKAVEASYAAEYRAAGGADWRDRYDDAMTRLYNYYSQTPVRAGFCAAASATIAHLATVSTGSLTALAPAELAALDQPFLDFYRAYDSWRIASVARTEPWARPVIAVSAATSTAPPTRAATLSLAAARAIVPPAPRPVAKPAAPPRLELDLGALPQDTLTGS